MSPVCQPSAVTHGQVHQGPRLFTSALDLAKHGLRGNVGGEEAVTGSTR